VECLARCGKIPEANKILNAMPKDAVPVPDLCYLKGIL